VHRESPLRQPWCSASSWAANFSFQARGQNGRQHFEPSPTGASAPIGGVWIFRGALRPRQRHLCLLFLLPVISACTTCYLSAIHPSPCTAKQFRPDVIADHQRWGLVLSARPAFPARHLMAFDWQLPAIVNIAEAIHSEKISDVVRGSMLSFPLASANRGEA
jgi:hypothetical protein